MIDMKKRDGFPDFVEFEGKHNAWAYVRLSFPYNPTTNELAAVLTMLNNEKYSYSGTTYELGYYDAVEDLTMEFNKP